MRHYIITIKTASAKRSIDVLAKSTCDAILSLRGAIPSEAFHISGRPA